MDDWYCIIQEIHEAFMNQKIPSELGGLFGFDGYALSFDAWPIDSLQREELEVVVLVKPGTLEVLERQIGSPT